MNPARGGWLIGLTLVAAMPLAILNVPLVTPEWLFLLRPDWAVGVLFFWAVTAPRRVGVFSAWFVGLFFDVLLGPSYTLGLHGICFAATVFIGSHFHAWLQTTHVVQQALVLGVVVLAVQATKGVARLLASGIEFSVFISMTALTTMVAYLLLGPPLRRLAERYVR